MVSEDPVNWKSRIPVVEIAMNSCVSKATGYTPYYLMTGREYNNIDSLVYGNYNVNSYSHQGQYLYETYHKMKKVYQIVADNLQSYHKRQKTAYDKNCVILDINAGDYVMLQKPKDKSNSYHKLKHPFIGPWIVLEKYDDHNVKIKRLINNDVKIEHLAHIRKIPNQLQIVIKQNHKRNELDQDESNLYKTNITSDHEIENVGDKSKSDLNQAEQDNELMQFYSLRSANLDLNIDYSQIQRTLDVPQREADDQVTNTNDDISIPEEAPENLDESDQSNDRSPSGNPLIPETDQLINDQSRSHNQNNTDNDRIDTGNERSNDQIDPTNGNEKSNDQIDPTDRIERSTDDQSGQVPINTNQSEIVDRNDQIDHTNSDSILRNDQSNDDYPIANEQDTQNDNLPYKTRYGREIKPITPYQHTG